MSPRNKKYSGVDTLEVLDAAKNYNRFLVSEIISCRGGSEIALDFGAGIGRFSEPIRDAGLKVVCVEPDPAMLQGLKTLGFESHSSLDDVPLESVDYIYSLNVLEHIENDLEALRQLFSRLRPGGTFFLYVPAFNLLYSSMDKKIGHFRRYKKPKLVSLLRQAGFRIEKAQYVDSLGFYVSLIYRFFGSKQGDLDSHMVAIYDSVIFPLSRMLDPIFKDFLGKNIEVICRK